MTDTDGREYGFPGTRFTISTAAITITKVGFPFSKKTDQKGVAKLAVFAYNRKTGRPVWQSGVVQSEGTSKDTWVAGAWRPRWPRPDFSLGRLAAVADQGRQDLFHGDAPQVGLID